MNSKKRVHALEVGRKDLVKYNIENYGFYIHYCNNLKMLQCCHTHCLVKSFNHLDLQINSVFKNSMIANLEHDENVLHFLVGLIKDGHRFKDGDIINDVLEDGYNIKLRQTVESGRPIFHVCLPDNSGKFCDNLKYGKVLDLYKWKTTRGDN